MERRYPQVNILAGFNLQRSLEMYADLDCAMSVRFKRLGVPIAKDAIPVQNDAALEDERKQEQCSTKI
jgi:hypothetical protein